MPEVQQKIAELEALLAKKHAVKCAIVGCSHEGHERNRVEAVVGASRLKHLQLYVCDEHYNEWVQS